MAACCRFAGTDLRRIGEEHHARARVCRQKLARHTFNVAAARMERAVEAAGTPYIKVWTDYSVGDQGQVETRLAAFIEML